MPDSRTGILIVDDDQSIRTFMSQTLAEIGYSVRIAEDGVAALLEIQKEIPGILISDLKMPRMSGFELLSVVRCYFPAIKSIAMSGSFSGDEVPSGVAADAFYQKGSSIVALLRIMETLPQIERRSCPTSSPEAPPWMHRSTHESSPHERVTAASPAALSHGSPDFRHALPEAQDRMRLWPEFDSLHGGAARRSDAFTDFTARSRNSSVISAMRFQFCPLKSATEKE